MNIYCVPHVPISREIIPAEDSVDDDKDDKTALASRSIISINY